MVDKQTRLSTTLKESFIYDILVWLAGHLWIAVGGSALVAAAMGALATPFWPLILIYALSLGLVVLVVLATYRDKRSKTPDIQNTRQSEEVTTPAVAAEVDAFYRTYDNRMLVQTEDLIRADTEKFPAGIERERFLVRQFATFIVIVVFEDIWSIIFRSQILLLQALNVTAMRLDDIETGFYIPASDGSPIFYSDYSFHQWIGYVKSQALVVETGDIIQISIRGREFLKYLVETGRSPDGRIH